MIDLSKVQALLKDCEAMIKDLHGVDFNEAAVQPGNSAAETGIPSSERRTLREQQAARSKMLQLLAQRLALAEQLVHNEWWFARGEIDPLDPERED